MTTSKITRWTLLLASCATLSLASCKDNDDAYERPSISVTQLTKDSNGNTLIGKDESTATLHIRTNRSWTATTALDWLSISPESGDAGERDVTIKVLKNASGATRQGQFAFKAGNETLYYTITQAGDGSAVITPGKDQPTPNLPSNPTTVDGAALAAFIEKYDKGQSVTVDEETTFKAVLLSDITANNMTSLKNIVVQAGEVGITLRLNANASKDWRPGAVFTIKTKGTKVGRYQDGSLQIDYTGLNDAASMVTPTGEVATITPKAVTFADIYAGKYDNILVAVDGAQFKTPGKELNPNKPAQGKTSAGSYFNALTDCATQVTAGVSDLSVAISYYSTFKTTIASDKNGRIVGIIQRSVTTNKTSGQSTKHYNLWPRTADDLAGLTAESRIALTGKLAAGASLVLRHKQATVYTAGTVADFSFNGNDPVALLKGTVTIDQVGNGMETAWVDSDKKFAGADIVLHRIASVKAPSATFSADQWERVAITKENQEATIKSYLGKR